MINWWNTKFGEEEIDQIANAIRSGNVSQGEVTAEFEQRLTDYLGVKHVVATSSGSTALTLALMSIGVSASDEIIVPNRSWIATAHAVTTIGAKVILADVEQNVPTIDVNGIESLITPKTKAIIAVHLNGRSANIHDVCKLAESYDLYVIEDAAQALGSLCDGHMLGTFGNVGCFSFSVAKMLATGQGGIAITDNDQIAGRLRAMRTHGVENIKDPTTWTMPGTNFRFTDIAASIGLVQLKKLPKRLVRAKTIYQQYYDELIGLDGVKNIPISLETGEVPVYNEFLFENRNELIEYLKEHDVDSRPSYPNLDKANYLCNGFREFPNSQIFERCGLVLPSGPNQSDENVHYVIDQVRKYFTITRN